MDTRVQAPAESGERVAKPGFIRIAVDGPAGSGKGTVARYVARALGYTYVDTGTLYRTLGFEAQRRGLDVRDEEPVAALARGLQVDLAWNGERLVVLLEGEDVTSAIRTESAGTVASGVAAMPRVRAALLDLQRSFGARGGVVMDGRDIGSVVLPDAELKVYLDASLDERARRRQLELQERGLDRPFESLRAEMDARDAQDRQRKVAPLQRLPDAFYVDSTGLSPQEAGERVLAEARRRGA